MLSVSENWKTMYPGASVGMLVMQGVDNLKTHAGLLQAKEALEQKLRERYAGFDRQGLRELPTLQAYAGYYRRFKKTYHLQLQLESILFKGKAIPTGAALVEAMFMAELEDQMLTAGHDLDKVVSPLKLDVAQGNEQYTRINKQSQILKKGDMYIADQVGILSSIIYGPDHRTRIAPDTSNVVYTTYAPQGVSTDRVRAHLENIRDYIFIVSPDALVSQIEVVTVDS